MEHTYHSPMNRAEKYAVLQRIRELTNHGKHKEANDLYIKTFITPSTK